MSRRLRREYDKKPKIAALSALLLSACAGSVEGARNWIDGANVSDLPGYSSGDGSTVRDDSNFDNMQGGTPNYGSSATSTIASSDGILSRAGMMDSSNCKVGTSPFRRITNAEYDNSLRDLLGDTSNPSQRFETEDLQDIFSNSANLQHVTEQQGKDYISVGVTAAENIADVKALIGCASDSEDCVSTFIKSLGARAYRRPLSDEESGELLNVYKTASSESGSADTGVRAAIASVLTSPNFLFYPEFGDKDSEIAGAKKLSGYEQAARLASLLWQSVPDDALLKAAESGKLSSLEDIEIQARNMLADSRAKTAIRTYFDEWFKAYKIYDASKNTTVYATWSDGLRNAMYEERQRFVEHVMFEDDGRLNTLFTADYSFVNKDIAAVYGVQGVSGDDFQKVQLDKNVRSGIVTQGAMLAALAAADSSSPIKRGVWVRNSVMCKNLQAASNVPPLPALSANVTNRERYKEHSDNDSCRTCHQMIDDVGFGLENYDGIGAWQTADSNGNAIDSAGSIPYYDENVQQGPTFTGGRELAEELVANSQVQDCAVQRAVRYALARAKTDDDTCSYNAATEVYKQTDGDLRELLVAVTVTDSFTNYRQAD